jgi:general stress protein 26
MTHQTDNQIVWGLMQKISFCMLTTHDNDGNLRARPMSAHVDPDNQAIFFLTDVRSYKDNEIDKNPNVCVAFGDISAHKYVSVTGHATVSDDRAKIDELWSIASRAWWDNKEDPNIRVLHVAPLRAEFRESPGGIVTSVKMAVALLTGTKPSLGENRKVEL